MRKLSWPSPAMIVAVTALVVAIGGTSWAAFKLPRNSVTSKAIGKGQVKRSEVAANAITSAKVKNESLLGKDFKFGQLPLGPRGERGPTGDAGPTGPTGATGASGVSQVRTVRQTGTDSISFSNLNGSPRTYTLALTLPAGAHFLLGRLIADNTASDTPGDVECRLRDPAQAILDTTDRIRLSSGAAGYEPFPLQATVSLTETGEVTLWCSNDTPLQEVKLKNAKLTAVATDHVEAFVAP